MQVVIIESIPARGIHKRVANNKLIAHITILIRIANAARQTIRRIVRFDAATQRECYGRALMLNMRRVMMNLRRLIQRYRNAFSFGLVGGTAVVNLVHCLIFV